MIATEYLAATPENLGLSSEKVEALFARVEADVAGGSLPSAQAALAREGRVAALRTFGTAVQGGEERPATNDTLYCYYSATKAVVAVAVWTLLEDERLALNERVTSIIPELGETADEPARHDITVEQVLLHTAGIPYAPMHPRLWEDRAARVERMRGWRLNWPPGSRWEYHATSAHWVLVELIERRSGVEFREYVRSRLTEPAGIPELYLGLPDALHARAADVVYVEDAQAPEGGWKEVNPETVLHFNLPSQRRAGCPGAGAFGGAGELALFYQTLLSGGESPAGVQVLQPETIDMATAVWTEPQHVNDAGVPVNRGLGVVVAGGDGLAEARGFGRATSARAFGHAGAGGQIAWADPQTGISFGYLTNGFATPEAIERRTSELSTLAADCLL